MCAPIYMSLIMQEKLIWIQKKAGWWITNCRLFENNLFNTSRFCWKYFFMDPEDRIVRQQVINLQMVLSPTIVLSDDTSISHQVSDFRTLQMELCALIIRKNITVLFSYNYCWFRGGSWYISSHLQKSNLLLGPVLPFGFTNLILLSETKALINLEPELKIYILLSCNH